MLLRIDDNWLIESNHTCDDDGDRSLQGETPLSLVDYMQKISFDRPLQRKTHLSPMIASGTRKKFFGIDFYSCGKSWNNKAHVGPTWENQVQLRIFGKIMPSWVIWARFSQLFPTAENLWEGGEGRALPSVCICFVWTKLHGKNAIIILRVNYWSILGKSKCEASN